MCGAIRAETPNLVSPPRTISDIAAILDQEKPDAAAIARLHAMADARPPADANDAQARAFHYQRAQARNALGRLREAVADIERASALLPDRSSQEAFRIQQYRIVLHRPDSSRTLQILTDMERDFGQVTGGAGLSTIYRHMIDHLVRLGDLEQAEAVLQKSVALLDQNAARSDADQELYRSSWEADFEQGRGFLLEARGHYRDAEAAFAKSERMRRDSLEKSARWPSRPPRASFQQVIDGTIISAGQVKALQGRLAEAEVDLRRALLSRLKSVGKYHQTTAAAVRQFGRVIAAQGRYAEAERLLRVAVEIYQSLGFSEASDVFLGVRVELAETLSIQSRWREAADVYAAVDGVIADWPTARKARYQLRRSRIQTLYRTGSLATGIELARALAAREKTRVGERHSDFAMATAILAVGLARAGRDEEALAAFRVAIPLLTSASREGEDEAGSAATRRDHQLRDVIEPYIALLAQISPGDAGARARETFGLADAIRGRSVQNALAAASARMVARDPALATLVRKEQDLRKQTGALFGLLNNLLSQPPGARDERILGDLRARIDTSRRDHERTSAEIAQRFPDYADLIDPKAATIEDLQQVLAPGEALLSFYFGREHSFVWAVPKSGPPSFAQIKAPAGEIEDKIKVLRKALEPNASAVGEIPPFDLGAAQALYELLLKPVEPAWKPARHLIVVTNGALGLMPLGLLPTAPGTVTAEAEPLFAGYRAVPWLARSHAVSAVPSAAALRTLRQLPPGAATRERFIGFADPFFSAEQAAEGDKAAPKEMAATTTRGLPLRRRAAPQTQNVDSAELALLPRLPDTADEMHSVALALSADPATALFLGKAANEARVKSADLSRYRVVAFATHGLVPGDLNGLTQPALALTAPKVAGVEGDGLLSMEEILALKLDADWVVLSACNTASGAEAGAEAASGLGRAFFYAGTRAILVTNWSVHSASARELVTDLFRRQAADASITRAEALRQAMLALLDRGGFADDSGKVLFAYAHPLFWAPYTIIGDGGAR